MNVAKIVVDPLFLDFYILALITLTVLRLYTAETRFRHELRDAAAISMCISGSLSGYEKRISLRRFAEDDNRLEGKVFKSQCAVREAVLTFLSAIEEIPRSRHVSEGLRPSENYFQAELARTMPRVANFGDTIIRLSLIGTFAGLIAALTIASTNIGSNLAQGSDATSQMQGFLQQLLSSAAVKFWISAVGLILALLIRIWQGHLDRISGRIARQIGRSFDRALDSSDVLMDWNCKVDGDPIIPTRSKTDTCPIPATN